MAYFLTISGGRFRGKRKRGIDYNDEIPFEKQPPPGFHDTSEDTNDHVSHNFKRMRHQDVVGERRDDIERVSINILNTIVFIQYYHSKSSVKIVLSRRKKIETFPKLSCK